MAVAVGLALATVITTVITIVLALDNRRLRREVERLNADANGWAKLAMEQDEQIQTMRRLFQGRQFKPTESPRRKRTT